ncbi:hypothetical protein LSTR_LSTR014709 [Laodelphax striatellus]|uniref:Uncharacterized protein n=1 Tax=Laodelphax striatellus TaxID=195883 RepID=A0A482WFJ9_LAOST|nr:hypothetical protein LSTR_LSTR014709 [Laodelphax striatellus]
MKRKKKISQCSVVIGIDGLTFDSRIKTPLLRQPLQNEILFPGCWTNELNRKEIQLENYGCLAVRYWFLNKSPLNDLSLHCSSKPSSRSFNRFYFPTNRFVLSPGQKATIPFYFFTKEPGVYKEIWELRSIPKIFAQQAVHINLVGSAVQRSVCTLCGCPPGGSGGHSGVPARGLVSRLCSINYHDLALITLATCTITRSTRKPRLASPRLASPQVHSPSYLAEPTRALDRSTIALHSSLVTSSWRHTLRNLIN